MTGILSPVVVADTVSPTEIIPGSVILTVPPATGEKVLLSGVTEAKSCAVILIGANNDKPITTLKNPESDVMVPLRGTTNAKLVATPEPPIRLIFPPTRLTPSKLLPNPTKEVDPMRLPTRPVRITGDPDEKGTIADAPVAPVGAFILGKPKRTGVYET